MTLPSVLVVPGAWHKPEQFRQLVDELSDVDVIARAASAIDGPLVVVAHSYGGVPTTQALSRAANVARIVYLASFQLEAGDALISANGGALMSWSRRRQRQGIGDFVEVITPMTPLTATAWQTIPSTVERLPTSHSPFLSQPAALAALIRESLENH